MIFRLISLIFVILLLLSFWIKMPFFNDYRPIMILVYGLTYYFVNRHQRLTR